MTEEKKTEEQGKTEEYILDGHSVLGKVKEIIKEGNARRIIIKNKEDKTMLEIPLTWAAIGTVITPTLAAIGALAALVSECKIVVERK